MQMSELVPLGISSAFQLSPLVSPSVVDLPVAAAG